MRPQPWLGAPSFSPRTLALLLASLGALLFAGGGYAAVDDAYVMLRGERTQAVVVRIEERRRRRRYGRGQSAVTILRVGATECRVDGRLGALGAPVTVAYRPGHADACLPVMGRSFRMPVLASIAGFACLVAAYVFERRSRRGGWRVTR